jgi:hypothetical protein
MQLIPNFGVTPAMPADPVPTRPQPRAGQAADKKGSASVEAVRALARKMAAGTAKMEHMHAVSPAVVQWLTSLDRVQLCRLVCAKPTELEAYMAGRGEIRGLPRYLTLQERPSPRRTRDPETGYEPRMAM